MKKSRFLCLFLVFVMLFGALSLIACDNTTPPDLPNNNIDEDSEAITNETDKESESGLAETDENLPAGTVGDGTWRDNMTVPVIYDPPTDELILAQSSFALELFKESVRQRENNKSLLISPLSVALALAMTANGAEEDTLKEFEELFGLSLDKINTQFRNYVSNLPSTENAKLHVANSIWFKNPDMIIRESFINTNKEFFGAEIMSRPFNKSTAEEINAWVDENTDGMIDHLIDDIDPSVMMYLINALVFDAKWADQYLDYQVRDGEFTSVDGRLKKVAMMSSEEELYINDGKAHGFIKPYMGGYSFVALLPDENMSVYDYVDSLDAEQLYALISNPQRRPVNAKLPQFKYEYSADMAKTLKAMGLERSFVGENAQFHGMGECSEGNLAISRIIHKTVIELTQAGTKAAAITAAEAVCESVMIPSQAPVNIFLDRPFVYMIIDNQTNLPIFTGIVTDIEGAEVLGSEKALDITEKQYKWSWEYDGATDKLDKFIVDTDNRKTFLRVDTPEELKELSALVYDGKEGLIADVSEDFFDENCLIMISFIESSGSIRHEVTSCSVRNIDDKLELLVETNRLCPFEQTADEMPWFIIIGLPAAELDGITDYKVSFTNTMIGTIDY